jgi:hypothetical protein
MTRILALVFSLLLATSATAHGPAKGTHGGIQVDAGDYHVEIVPGGKTLTLYMNDKEEKAIDAKGLRAVGLFVVGGKAQRIELTSAGANKLTGTAPVDLPATLKGSVQITLPDGKTVQAKFE